MTIEYLRKVTGLEIVRVVRAGMFRGFFVTTKTGETYELTLTGEFV